ncbi:MAG: hypothetical protein NT150_02745 [Bacteroidetes bacterium]|nr:hypothetical protein [Bacteroidota bacterium]
MIKTTTSSIELDSFGIIQNTFKTRSAFKPVYVLEQANTIRQILQGKKAPIIVDASKVDQIKLSHYAHLLKVENIEYATAIAVFVDSSFQRNLLNFLYGIKKPACPFKVFTSRDEAIIWLQKYA